MPLDHVLDDISAALQDATTVRVACHRAVSTLHRHTPAMIAALLHVHEHLRSMAAVGSWSVFSSTAPGTGVVGRVYDTGETVVVSDGKIEPGYARLSPPPQMVICVPIFASDDTPIGVLNVEWTTTVDVPTWRLLLERVGVMLGKRINELGGPPTETRAERLLRHGLAMTTAESADDLIRRSLVAAREVSGLSTPVVLLPEPRGVRVFYDRTAPTSLARRFAALDPRLLAQLARRGRQHGASYTLGDPAELGARGFEALTGIGVRTMITVLVGPGRGPGATTAHTGGVLVVVDEEASKPDSGTINLLELLVAQAWTANERLETVATLRELAISDPLTGLRHNGPFGERLALAKPEHTALLVVDVDRFKDINDTYGHQEGDRALVDLAQALQAALRTGDELYRVGGDEFAAVLDVQRQDEAVRIAGRLTVAAREVGWPVSVGVAVRLPGESPKDTLRRADTALYEAKRTGRDGVRVAYPLHDVAEVA